ncbi:MAG TPA: dipeptide/oligopeptide/nickel ABC transporter ATP-binding protein, partial [Clostridiales bacterium]|nr:dipeptide/oligopeptide/nickel ABC transporter ATP-binding protein [Clostridiales bacterium]
MEKQTNKHYLTNKEIREIAKENLRQMKKYEKAKKAKLPESAYVTEMKRDDTILEIDNLHTYFFTESGVSKAVNGVSFDIPQGSVVGVVGESGCGKSVTSLAIMRLVQGPQGQIVNGSIR